MLEPEPASHRPDIIDHRVLIALPLDPRLLTTGTRECEQIQSLPALTATLSPLFSLGFFLQEQPTIGISCNYVASVCSLNTLVSLISWLIFFPSTFF